MESCASELC